MGSEKDYGIRKIRKSLQDHTNLRFHQVGSKAEAKIVFAFPVSRAQSSTSTYKRNAKMQTTRDHELRCPTKFAPAVLAHAFFPTSGQIHFNLAYQWDQGDQSYRNLKRPNLP